VRELSFLDQDRGWLAAGREDDIRLFGTVDGGKTWSPMSADALKSVDRAADVVDFVSEKVGFLFAAGNAGEQSDTQTLYTSDGGSHWLKQNLPYSVHSCEAFEGDLLCSASSGKPGFGVLTLHPRER
jgi:photosystem II stability/assembly factor-like uncharacterized protein